MSELITTVDYNTTRLTCQTWLIIGSKMSRMVRWGHVKVDMCTDQSR